MSSQEWQDWSCTVRLVVGQDGSVPPAATQRAGDLVRALMADVERAVSRFRPDSELEVVNEAAPRLLPVSPLLLTLVDAALEAARQTGGATDPTVGAHLLALGYDADLAVVRGRTAVLAAGARRRADWTRVVVDRDLGRLGVPRGLRLDLGATAKAWTADEAAHRVAASLGLPVLVEIGGDVAVAGPAAEPWRVRVAETAGGPGTIVGLTHGGLATSSTVHRRWSTTTGAAHHVIDPATGRPTDGPIRTASVWAPTALAANTLSTAALVWGPSAPARLALAGADARLVRSDDRVLHVGAWPAEEVAA